MGSCMTRFGDPNGRVLWYTANSPESLEWQTKKTGFGYRRDKSFLEAALDREGYTRMGNSTGGLAGKLLVYQKAESDMDYSSIPESPTIRFKDGEKLFAKAFLKVPLGRTPIGENNYIPSDDPRGQGATLLASRPRVIAIYLDVDGKPQVNEHFCSYSKDDFNGRLENFDPKPKTLTEALPGSFFTYMCCPEQDPYCFLHFPLVGSLSDTTFKTGVYGESLVRCFCDLLVQLDPGIHQFDIKVKYAYDHSDYNCLILGEGTNALGRWYKKISNNKLISPHEDPEVLETPDEAVACGTFMLDLMRRYANTMVDQLDRKPPPELYFSQDAEQLRRIARVGGTKSTRVDYKGVDKIELGGGGGFSGGDSERGIPFC